MGFKLVRISIRPINISTPIFLLLPIVPSDLILCGHPLSYTITFDFLRWKLAHQLNIYQETFTFILFFSTLYRFRVRSPYGTDRQTDGRIKPVMWPIRTAVFYSSVVGRTSSSSTWTTSNSNCIIVELPLLMAAVNSHRTTPVLLLLVLAVAPSVEWSPELTVVVVRPSLGRVVATASRLHTACSTTCKGTRSCATETGTK